MNTDLKTKAKRKKKELLSIRTKLSYYKVFHRKRIGNRNEKKTNNNNKKTDTYE